MKQYVLKAREAFKLQEDLLSVDARHDEDLGDHSWDSDMIKDGLRKMQNS